MARVGKSDARTQSHSESTSCDTWTNALSTFREAFGVRTRPRVAFPHGAITVDLTSTRQYRVELALCQKTPVAARQIAEANVPDPAAGEMLYTVAERIKHPANLSVNSLSQNNA